MVNTFLTDADFRKSAKNLDRQRLGKQRVEALQILQVCQDLQDLGNLFDSPLSQNQAEGDWIRLIAQKYRSYPYSFIFRKINSTQIMRIAIRKESLAFLPKKKAQVPYLVEAPQETFYYYPDDHLVKLGWCYHPAVKMWLGFEDALKAYIQAHIQEFIARGYKNNLIIDPPENIRRPSWTFDPELHQNHRAALLKKEIDRKEPSWYAKIPEFTSAGPFIDYKWKVDK